VTFAVDCPHSFNYGRFIIVTATRTILILLALSLAACASNEGTYEPSCVAYEGDRLKLAAGRFEWQRFTDERVVNESGDVVEPFPGFPKSGTYRVNDDKLELVTNDGVRLDDWFVIEHAGQRYLLDAKQHNTFVDTSELPECALRFTPAASR
jgi:hypothetical protein